MLTVKPILVPRDLTPKEKRILKRLSRRKYYDQNQNGTPQLVLQRVFVPASHKGNPVVLLLCRITAPDRRGGFEFCVYTDGLYGRGHHPSDSFGSGNMAAALASFEEHIAYELIGVWPWVIRETFLEAKRVARRS